MVLDRDATIALRTEKMRAMWDHAAADVELHRDRLLSLMAADLLVALSAIVSVVTGTVARGLGLVVVLVLLTLFAALQRRFSELPHVLGTALAARIKGLDNLIAQEVE